MSKIAPEHDTLAFRLAEILLKLNLGESLNPQALADEFKVSTRTIFRDLNRLGGIVDKQADGRYQLVGEYRGKLTTKDLTSFAKLAGVEQLFPNSSPQFLVALLDTLSHSSFLVKGHHYEEVKPNDANFKRLDSAIREHRVCQLTYSNKSRLVEPYRLINSNGIWYLAAKENQQLKTFSFSRISHLSVTEQQFTPELEIIKEIEGGDNIWFSQEKTEVLLSVAPQIAYYFLRRKLLPQQETIKEVSNGGLIISSQISHTEQIMPLIRYWLPNIKILEPAWLRDKMDAELKEYIGA